MTETSTMSPNLNTRKRGRLFPLFGGGGGQKEQHLDLAVPEAAADPQVAEALQLLGRLLGDRVARNKLITAVSKWNVSPSSDPTRAIRFCAAVEEFSKVKDKVEKKSKGRKIVAMFIQSGAMFQLNHPIPEQLSAALLQEKFDNLLVLKARLMSELAADEQLISRIKDLEL